MRPPSRLPLAPLRLLLRCRLYQPADGVNLGCSPSDYPTEQYIACNKAHYIVRDEDEVLVPAECRSGVVSGAARRAAGAGALVALAAAVVAVAWW